MIAPRIAVLDYGAGNLVSIDQALARVGAQVSVVRDPASWIEARPDAVVVPGVGAAAPAMDRLERRGLVTPLLDWLRADRPFLGICLGLQLLFEASDEDGAATLGVLSGRTIRLLDAPTLPHIGWNQVEQATGHPLFDGIADAADFYFVHSYAGSPNVPGDNVIATTQHGGRFPSAIGRGRTVGVQFHPERSGDDGMRLLANFVSLIAAEQAA